MACEGKPTSGNREPVNVEKFNEKESGASGTAIQTHAQAVMSARLMKLLAKGAGVQSVEYVNMFRGVDGSG